MYIITIQCRKDFRSMIKHMSLTALTYRFSFFGVGLNFIDKTSTFHEVYFVYLFVEVENKRNKKR